jgi:tRNA(Ser,Leu) C12 N-acetylase TAN1
MTHDGNGQQDARWNVLVTAQEGAARDLKRIVNHYGSFRWSHYRNVLLGHVADPQEFFRTFAADLERKPFVNHWLGKVVPIATTFPVRAETFLQDVEAHLVPLLDQLKGKSFHIRVERRGHKGQLHTHELEQRLGEYVWQVLERQQAQPTVSFKNPDIVVAVEIAGATAGIGLVPHRLQEDFPFVKVD